MPLDVALAVGFLLASLALYVVFGGADFGAGILDLLARKDRERQREVISKAMAPVWEANHVWLVLAVVILFTAFPPAFARIMTYFHIPLTLMLAGIVLRGCAFTFRHYDQNDAAPRGLYSGLFGVSSVLTPFAQGLIVGGVMQGVPPATGDFYSAYVAPWFSPFPAGVGVFFCVLASLLASVFLVGETSDVALQRRFHRKARNLAFLSVALGALLIGLGKLYQIPALFTFTFNPVSIGSVISVVLLFALLPLSLRTRSIFIPRFIVAAIVVLILSGWWASHLPEMLHPEARSTLYINPILDAAPPATIRNLVGALIAGTALIIPALGYLLIVFKTRPSHN